LKSKGLSDNTQALIYFAVAKKGDQPIDGKTDINPEVFYSISFYGNVPIHVYYQGLTAVTGRWASDFSERLQKGDLACKVLNKNDWYVSMLEKHIWICSMMAVGVKYKCTVGEVEGLHNAEVRELISEMAIATEKVIFVSHSKFVESSYVSELLSCSIRHVIS